MIARSALFAIWRPKLADTFLTPNASRLDGPRRGRLQLAVSSVVSVSVRIWKLW